MMERLTRRLRLLLGRSGLERELEEQMRFHVDMEAQELERTQGLTPAEARRRARVAFGSEERMREATRAVYGLRLLEELATDVRMGFRLMRRSPGFTAVAVLTLALGIGATTAMFSVVDGVLLRPLPYPESERLVSVWGRFLPESGFDFPKFPLSPPEYEEYREHSRALKAVAAYHGYRAAVIQNDGNAISVRAIASTPNLFGVLGVTPAFGRTFEDEREVAVLGHGLWQRAFGGDPGVIGRTIRSNGRLVEVIGVMQPGFAYPNPEVELWTPVAIAPGVAENRTAHFLQAVGRLADGVEPERAHSELSALMARWRADYPDIHTGHFLYIQPLKDDIVGDARPALVTLLIAVGFVLLIVCVNLMNLLLARGEARQRELAVRSSLGAGRLRLLRQFLAEGATLSFVGGLCALVVAWLAIDATVALGAHSIPRVDNVTLDARALLFSAAVALLVALMFAAAPALGLVIAEPHRTLREESRSATGGRRRARLRSALVAAQVAFAVIIVIGAGLTVRSFHELMAVPPGFRAENVLVAELAVPEGDYPGVEDIARFYEDMAERMRALPGVRAATAVSTLPLGGGANNIDFEIEGVAPPAPGEPAHSGDLVVADAGYAATMSVRMIEGRFFEPSDRIDGMPVTVVNRTLARMFWADGSAVGKRIRIASGGDAPWLTVVGVIDDVQYRTLDEDVRPAWYLPLAQLPLSLTGTGRQFTVAVRSDGDPLALAPAVRSEIRTADASVPVLRLRPLETVVAQSVATPRFTMAVLGLFAVVALVLGAIGIYGVLAWTVARRTREFGIRMALGASRSNLTRIVLGQALQIVIAGLAVGLAGALLATKLMSGLLFGVSATDPITYGIVSGVVAAVGTAACIRPLARALRADPARVLRAD